jgi:hypothetical protein
VKTYYAKDASEYFREINTPRNQTFAVRCPCCQRDGVVYWRKLNSGMCLVLINMAKALHKGNKKEHAWLSLEEFFPKGSQKHRDWTMMRHWTLIEPQDTRTATENAPGVWRITPAGHGFLKTTWNVASHGAFYENNPLRWSDRKVSILQALGKRFDYYELMQGLPLLN